MTDSTHASQPPAASPAVCPTCGGPLPDPPELGCPTCDDRPTDVSTTSEDHSVYAERLAEGRSGWGAMCKSVFGAGKHRLAHLGLARPSRPAKRFARVNLFLLAVGMGLAAFSNAGWHTVERRPRIEPAEMQAAGTGWWLAIENAAAKVGPASRIRPVELWLNLPAATVSAVIVLIASLIVFAILVRLIAFGARQAIDAPPDEPPRLRSAVQYATAWSILLVLATVPVIFRPLAYIAEVAEWSLPLSRAVFDVPAVLLALAGMLLWWFWLIRLGETVPRQVRRSVSRFFLLGVPVLSILVLGGGAWGTYALVDYVTKSLNFAW